jgi:hypothetical protein
LLLAHPDHTAGEKLIGIALSEHLNFTTLQLNPSVDRLAALTAQCSRSVEKQLKKLRASGLLAWDKKGFRTSNRYYLTIPNSERELIGRVDELWAGIANTELSAGIDNTPTPNSGPRNPEPSPRLPRTLGGRNLERTLKEPARRPPHAPGGAAAAADNATHAAALASRLGVAAEWVRTRHGDAQLIAWFDDADIDGKTIIAGSPAKANWIREKFVRGIQVDHPGHWQVVDRTKVAAGKAA